MRVTPAAAARSTTPDTSGESWSSSRWAWVSKRSIVVGTLRVPSESRHTECAYYLIQRCLQLLQILQVPLGLADDLAGGGLGIGGHVEALGQFFAGGDRPLLA